MDRKKILLVDDVPLFLELAKTFFHGEEFALLTAPNGKEALEKARSLHPHLILMDLFMPVMDGDEACRRIKEDEELGHIPVIMVTQGGREEDLARCRDAGCDEIVLKPINRHHLLSAARKFLRLPDRSDPRYPARLCVQYGTIPQDPASSLSHNLSIGGVFLETERPMAVETPLVVEFMVPTIQTPISCKGRVAWVNHPNRKRKPHFPPGMGLQFLNLSHEDRRAIRDYLLHG